MSRAIGIDLGTYNSAAAVALGRERVAMVESKFGRTVYGKNFPSFVLFDRLGRKQRVGQRAKEELRLNPDLVIWGVKRLVGLPYRTALAQGELARFQYGIEEGPGGSILIQVGDERYTPSHILEFILREIKEDAEDPKVNPLVGDKVEKAIISIPAYFKAIRTAPIVEAALRAGFEEVDTIAEPTAAAIYYSLDIEKEANILAFDMGAGTLDVTVMMIVNEQGILVPGELCTSGHEALGGIDMDDLLISHMGETHGLGPLSNSLAEAAILKDEVEKAKIRLSTKADTIIDLPGGRQECLSRSELEEVLGPLFDKCKGPIRVALGQAGLEASDIDHVLFIGGPTRMPGLRKVVRNELEQLGARPGVIDGIDDSRRTKETVDPMECVAKGASLKAGRVVEPVGKVLAEGYGIMYGPVPGEQPYYAPIIDENAHYPITAKGALSHCDPSSLEIPIPLVAKRPDVERSTSGEIVYKYEHLGDYTLSVTPTGRIPSIDIQLQVTDDKRIVASIVHSHNRQQVRFEGLNLMTGESLELQEHTPPQTLTEDVMQDIYRTTNPVRGHWSKRQLEHHLHVAREAMHLAEDVAEAKVSQAKERVERAIDQAVAADLESPDIDCPNIANRVKELLDVLHQPTVARISLEEFRHYLEELVRVAQMTGK